MKDPDRVLRALYVEECRHRSEDPLLDLKARRPTNPAWRPVGTAFAAAGVLAAAILFLQFSGPSELDRLIVRSLPDEKSWNRVLETGSRFVITALEPPEER